MKHIGIYIYDDAEELDFAGPYEVFTMINTIMEHQGRPDAVKVSLISKDGSDITGKKGMRVGAHAACEDISALDIICLPGGYGSRQQITDPDIINWVKDIAKTCEWVTSVCTGSFILAKAGLTEGKRLSTFWGAFDEFKALGLPGELVPHLRYVRDGNVVTSAGVSAGIDMALWLTGQMFTPGFARKVQRGMQYDPAPPYTAET